ncbi:MAG: hydroxyisourate hydrolase [Bacteroidia bacterium]
MSQVTTRIVDTLTGKPIKGIMILLEKHVRDEEWHELTHTYADEDGNAVDLLSEGINLIPGLYRLAIPVGIHYEQIGVEPIFPIIYAMFEIKDRQNYNIPILVGPNSFTVYREKV